MEDHFRINLFHSIPKGKAKLLHWNVRKRETASGCVTVHNSLHDYINHWLNQELIVI